MRIAVIFSGLLRNFEHTYLFFKRYIDNSIELKKSFNDLNVDYFFYGYSNKSGTIACEKKIEKLLNPKKYKIVEWNDELKNLIKVESDGLDDLDLRKVGSTSPINCLSSHRCKLESNNLRKKWSQENNVKHDVVIYARIDSFFFREILKKEIDVALQDNSILIPPDWDFKCIHDVAVCDMFAMGNESTMNRYFQSYKEIPYLVRSKGYVFHPETLQGAHIVNSGIKRIECSRHFAFEYPYSKGDLFKLWQNSWNKSEIENLLSISLDEMPDNYRYTT